MSLSMHWTETGSGMTWEQIEIVVMQMRLDFGTPSFLDLAKPEWVKSHRGLWVCVSEYGIILNSASSKEALERNIPPHHGCSYQLVRVP
ncbi:MAG: hypothetical protein OK454_00200 [Thaumarchaeota archaeon]|nr:hypothetical protein [Nitrososphaerota archaeon]